MKRLFISVMLLASPTGCTGLRPVGPLAERWMADNLRQSAATPQTVTVPAPRPTPPTNLVAPDDVLPDNPQAAIAKLKSELEADRWQLPEPPRTAAISRIRSK